MKRCSCKLSSVFAILFGFTAFFMPGCGGAGGGGGESPGAEPTQGTVALFLADGPARNFEKIWITVTKVLLIPEDDRGRKVTIYEGEYTLDLLELRDEDFLFTVCRDVPPGWYSKIRLYVSRITGEGGPCDSMRLPSGKIDLNPRGAFEVKAGATVAVRLDIDADKSIHIAHNGKCNFRPVVFVDITTSAPTWRCPRMLSGTIVELIGDEHSHHGSPGETTNVGGFFLDLRSHRGELEVVLGEDTVIFDSNGESAGRELLRVGSPVKVRGRLDRKGRFVASLIVTGEKVVLFKGEALGPTDGYGVFAMQVEAGTGFTEGRYEVAIQEETVVLAGCDTAVSPEMIDEGVRIRAFGIYDGKVDILRSVLVFVEPFELSGEIVSVRESAMPDEYLIEIDPGGDEDDVEVVLTRGGIVRLEGDGLVPVELLCPGTEVRVRFMLESGDTTIVDTIVVQPRLLSGLIVEDPDIGNRLLVLDGGLNVRVQPTATIIMKNTPAEGEEEHIPLDFEDLEAGHGVDIWALPACHGGTYEGFVVIVSEAALAL